MRRALTPPERREALAHLGSVIDELYALLREACADGPYVNGARPAAADFMLLPWLERTEALLPAVPGSAGVLTADAWVATRSLLDAARASTAFADYEADPESLWADLTTELTAQGLPSPHATARPSVGAAEPPGGGGAERADGEAEADELSSHVAECMRAAPSAKREAAAQLASRHAAIARFAWRKARLPPTRIADGCADAAAPLLALEATLQALTSQLLSSQSQKDVRAASTAAAARISRHHGRHAAHDSSIALTALASNVAVPRDLRREAAQALRAHTRVLAAALREGGSPTACTPHTRL